jgi:hypothetical protein
MRPGLGMDGNDVGAGLGERRDIGVDRRNHQVAVDHLAAGLACRRHHDRAHGDVGHEVPVHHVDMDVVGPSRVDGADFLAQPGEIGRKNRGCDPYRLTGHCGAPCGVDGVAVALARVPPLHKEARV